MTEPTYTPTSWVNNSAPAIDADNLNHLESGVQVATERATESIRYDQAQSLTSAQQAQARSNLALSSFYVPIAVEPSGDTTGATDTPLIQAALNSGGHQRLVPGTYWVNATLKCPTGVTLTGAGKGVTILKAASGLNAPVISNVDQVNGNFYIALKSFTVDGNKTTMTGFPYTGVYFYGCGQVTYEDFEVQNSSNVGIYMDGLALVSSRYVWLHNVEAHDNIGSGIQISNATRATHMSGVYAYNNSTHGIFWDMSESTANGIYAYNNTNYGVYVRNVFNCVFNNVNSTRNGEHGIFVVAMNDSVGSDWMAIENGANGPEPGGGWADIYFDPTGTPTWGYGTTKGIVISGVRAGALMAQSHNWKPNNIVTPTNVPDYGVYISDGINGDVTLRDVLIGTVGVQELRLPASPGSLVVGLAGDPDITFDSTLPADDGTVSATGTATTAARRDHTHGRYGFTPADHGLITWPYDPSAAPNPTTLPASGTVYVIKVHVPHATSVTNIVTQIYTAGSGLTAGECFAGIYQNGTLIGATADQSTAWASAGVKTMAITGGPVSLAAGDAYIAFLFNGTTGPALPVGNGNSLVNVGLASTAVRYGQANTAVTTLPSTLGSISGRPTSYWAALS